MIADLVKIVLLSEIVGVSTIVCFKYFFKAIGIDFKKWRVKNG